MNTPVAYCLNHGSATEIADHLQSCDFDFVPPLSTRVDLGTYVKKLSEKATRFEAWSNDKLIGLVAAYCNDQANHIAYITSVSVLKSWTGSGIASGLLNMSIEHAKHLGMHQIRLEVAQENLPAVKLYEKKGFSMDHTDGSFIGMSLDLARG